MNDSEQSQVHNMAGFVEFSTDDHWGALAEYEQLLAQGDDVPSGLRQQTLYTLAQLNFVVEEYQASLRLPGGLEHLNIGLDQAREQDVQIPETGGLFSATSTSSRSSGPTRRRCSRS